jgi:hypothetical protein
VSQVETTGFQTWAGIALIAAAGVIHLVETPENYEEVRYIGILFAVSVLGAFLAAFGIARNEQWGWGLGTVVAGGAVLAYLITRTVGLPGFRENSWESFAEPVGLLCLLVESLFLMVAANVFALRSLASSPGTATR